MKEVRPCCNPLLFIKLQLPLDLDDAARYSCQPWIQEKSSDKCFPNRVTNTFHRLRFPFDAVRERESDNEHATRQRIHKTSNKGKSDTSLFSKYVEALQQKVYKEAACTFVNSGSGLPLPPSPLDICSHHSNGLSTTFRHHHSSPPTQDSENFASLFDRLTYGTHLSLGRSLWLTVRDHTTLYVFLTVLDPPYLMFPPDLSNLENAAPRP
jgi:hypothetical protein